VQASYANNLKNLLIIFQLPDRMAQLQQNPGYFYVSHDPLYLTYLGASTQFAENAFWLDGRDIYKDGAESFITLQFTANEIQQFTDTVPTKVFLTLCYPFTTGRGTGTPPLSCGKNQYRCPYRITCYWAG